MPEKSCTLIIALIISQNIIISSSFKIIGKAVRRVEIIFLRFFKEEIVFSGRKTRTILRTENRKSPLEE